MKMEGQGVSGCVQRAPGEAILSQARWAACWAWTSDWGSEPVSVSLLRTLSFGSGRPTGAEGEKAEAGWPPSSIQKGSKRVDGGLDTEKTPHWCARYLQ